MTLAVGFGYELSYLLDLPLTSFDALIASIVRTRRTVLAESGIVMHLAAQGETKSLMDYLRALTGADETPEAKREKIEAHVRASQEMNAKPSKRRRRA